MTNGRHFTVKKKSDPTYDPRWSGVSYAEHCSYGCFCPIDGEQLHLEGHDAHYCPRCDDFRAPSKSCKNK